MAVPIITVIVEGGVVIGVFCSHDIRLGVSVLDMDIGKVERNDRVRAAERLAADVQATHTQLYFT